MKKKKAKTRRAPKKNKQTFIIRNECTYVFDYMVEADDVYEAMEKVREGKCGSGLKIKETETVELIGHHECKK